jgi:energy-coupling factor transporter ATP-binding protein EcfA2
LKNHPDALGYLSRLSQEINQPWFKLICDLAIEGYPTELDQLAIDTLLALYLERASYRNFSQRLTSTADPAVPAQTDFLERLGGFSNFKRLTNDLNVIFEKRVTLIFGTNGSGKSSLCESLKILAASSQPIRPVENALLKSTIPPTFSFKFKSDPNLQTWNRAVGYGPKQATVKYFDTAVAIQNVTNSIEPSRVVVVAPFKLHVFESTKVLTSKFREVLVAKERANVVKLMELLQQVRSIFSKFNRDLAQIDENSLTILESQIELGQAFDSQELLQKLQGDVAALEKASSDDGLKLLKAEHQELVNLLVDLNTLHDFASRLWASDRPSKAKILSNKQIAQKELVKDILPAVIIPFTSSF